MTWTVWTRKELPKPGMPYLYEIQNSSGKAVMSGICTPEQAQAMVRGLNAMPTEVYGGISDFEIAGTQKVRFRLASGKSINARLSPANDGVQIMVNGSYGIAIEPLAANMANVNIKEWV